MTVRPPSTAPYRLPAPHGAAAQHRIAALRRTAAPFAVLAVAYVVGGVPFAQVAARRRHGVDLRNVGTGTVSGTALFRLAGFRVLAAYGVLEVGKGAVAPLLAARLTGDRHGRLAAAATAVGVAGHNWSPFLRLAGGRGVSPAMGALAVTAPSGAAVLGAGLAAGKLADATALGCAVADALLVPVVAAVGGRRQVPAAAAVLVPMLGKRLMGNGAPARRGPGVYLRRLLLDRDDWSGQ